MPERSVPLSVRLSSDEAAFLAGYNSPGAKTLSEKLRAIIAEARQRHVGSVDYGECLSFAVNLLAPTQMELRRAEARIKAHSELVAIVMNWLPETTAYLMANSPRGEQSAKRLNTLEADLADRVFSLMEQTLRLGVTGESPCFDPTAVSSRSHTVVKLSEIIKDATRTSEER